MPQASGVHYRGKVDGQVMFSISGPEERFVLNEVARYTHQYAEEGPVFVEKKNPGGRWCPVVLFTQPENPHVW